MLNILSKPESDKLQALNLRWNKEGDKKAI
jgi:hypothetical protein